MLISVKKKKKNYGATFANFSSTFNLSISTYQSTGTSDWRAYFQKLSDQSRVYIQDWRVSTGGAYVPVEEFSLSQFITYMMNNTLYIEFKDQNQATSTWWLPSPILDELTGYETPELLNNVISAYIRGNTIDFNTDDAVILRKPGAPTNTTMTVKLRIGVLATQTYPNDGYVSIYFRNIQGSPLTYTEGNHNTRLIKDDNEALGAAYTPITTTTPVLGSNNQKIMSTIRASTYRIYSYGGTTLKKYSPATDAFRTAAFNSLYTAGASFGSYCISDDGTADYTGQVGIFHGLQFPNPSIERTGFPYLQVRLVITGNVNMRLTVWNTTSGYIYVNGQQSYQNIYFMSDGAGQGSSQISGLSGNIVCVFFQADQYGFAINTTSIPRFAFAYATLLTLAQATPNTSVSQTFDIPNTLRYQGGALQMTAHFWYATTTNPPDPDIPPQPVPIPPVPTPVIPVVSVDDTILRQEKAVEEVKQVFEGRNLVPVQKGGDVFKEMAEEFKQTGKISGVDSQELLRVRQIIQKKEVSVDDQVFLDAMVAKKSGTNWYSPSHFQQSINNYAQIVNEIAAIQMFNREIISALGYRGSRSIGDLQAIIKGHGSAHLYPGIMNPNAYVSVAMAGHSNMNDLVSAINRRDHAQIYGKIPKFSEKVSDSTLRNSLQWVQQGVANYEAKGKHNMISQYGLPYNPFNYTTDVFDMRKHPTPPQFFNTLSQQEIDKLVEEKGLAKQPDSLARYVSPEPSGFHLGANAGINVLGALGVLSPGAVLLINGLAYAYDRVESFQTAYNDPATALSSLGIDDVMILGGYQLLTIASVNTLDALFYTAQLGALPGAAPAIQMTMGALRNLPAAGRAAWKAMGALTTTMVAYDQVYKKVIKPLVIAGDIDQSFRLGLNTEQKGIVGLIAGDKFVTKDEIMQTTSILAYTANAVLGSDVVDIESLDDLLNSKYGNVAYRSYLIIEGLMNPGTKAAIGIYAAAKVLEKLGIVEDAYGATRNKIFQTGIQIANSVTGLNLPMPQFDKGEEIKPEAVPTLDDMTNLIEQEILQNLFGVSKITDKNRPYVTGQMANNAFRGALLGIGARLALGEIQDGIEKAQNLQKLIESNDTKSVSEVLRSFGFLEFLPKDEFALQTIEQSRNTRKPQGYYKQDLTFKLLELELVRGANEYAQKKAETLNFHSLLWGMISKNIVEPVKRVTDIIMTEPMNDEFLVPTPRTFLQRDDAENVLTDAWFDIGEAAGNIAYDIARKVVNLSESYTDSWIRSLRDEILRMPPQAKQEFGRAGEQIRNQTEANKTSMPRPLLDALNISRGNFTALKNRFSNATIDKFSEVSDYFKQNISGSNTTYGDVTLGLLAAGIVAGGGAYVYNKATQNTTTQNTSQPEKKREAKAQNKAYESYSYFNPARYYHQIKGTPKADSIDLTQTQQNITSDVTNLAAHEAKHLDPTSAMKLWAATVIASLPPKSNHEAVLSDPSVADTSEGRRKTLDAIHAIIHGAQKHMNYESPVVRNGILSALSAYFQAGITHARASRNDKTLAFFSILQAILRPSSKEDYNIQRQFESYMHKDLANFGEPTAFGADNEIEALHTIGRHPRLLSDFIERVLVSSHSSKASSLGGRYTDDRFRPDYELPELLKIREKKQKPIVVREPVRARPLPQPSKKMSFLQPRDASEMSQNREFNLKRRKM